MISGPNRRRSTFKPSATRITLFALAFASAVMGGCTGVPYTAIVKAAQNEETPVAQARDKRLKMKLRRALVENELLKGLSVTPYVLQDRAFIVGAVNSREQADALTSIARESGEFLSVQGYLPVVPGDQESTFTADKEMTAEIKARFVATPGVVPSRTTVKIIGGHVVLLGVVESAEKEAVLQAVQSVKGVKGITDFLMLPDPEYKRLRPGLR